jgi:hypothetical protein
MHAHAGTSLDTVIPEEATSELGRTTGVVTEDLQSLGTGDRDEECWRRRGRADTSKPAASKAAKIQYPEMQPRWCLDEEALIGTIHQDSAAVRNASRTN